jgi:hypothetical protein
MRDRELLSTCEHVAVQHERGPRKVKPKVHSVSNMILPASSGSSAAPVACSSSPTMASISVASVSSQMIRKMKYPSQVSQSQMSCLSTMENYNSFSTIINQVNHRREVDSMFHCLTSLFSQTTLYEAVARLLFTMTSWLQTVPSFKILPNEDQVKRVSQRSE